MFSAGEYKNKYIQEWFKFCKRNQIDKGEVSIWHYEYTHYYFAQALYSLGDDGWEKMFPGTPANERMTWTAYRNAVFDNLMRTQNARWQFSWRRRFYQSRSGLFHRPTCHDLAARPRRSAVLSKGDW